MSFSSLLPKNSDKPPNHPHPLGKPSFPGPPVWLLPAPLPLTRPTRQHSLIPLPPPFISALLLKGSLNLSWSYLLRELEQITKVMGDVFVQSTGGGKGKFGKDEKRLKSEEGVMPRTGTLEFVFEELFRRM